MSPDEIMRALFYSFIIPGATYMGVRVWNGVIMPPELRRPIAIWLWLQAAIYAMFMVGLFLLRLWNPSQALLWFNTMLIGLQAATTIAAVVQVSRLRKVKSLLPIVLFFIAMLLLLG